MAHCPYEKLSDLQLLLEKIRGLEKLKEPKPGIFYFKGQGFLHFHTNKEHERWMDVREGEKWGKPIMVPQIIRAKELGKIFQEIEKRYLKTLKP